jgi:hypothetical protein
MQHTEAPGVNLRDIGEVTGLAALHGTWFLHEGPRPSPAGLYELVCLSRQRLRTWWDELAVLAARQSDDDELERLAQEVLVSEVSSRVLAACLSASALPGDLSAAPAFGRQIVLDQLQANQAVLQAWLQRCGPLPATLRLNRLRRVCERWSDLLLGHSAVWQASGEFAVDPERMRDFRESAAPGDRDARCQLALISLRQALPDVVIPAGPRAEAQRALLQGLLALLPQSAFHWDGRLKGDVPRRVSGGWLLHDVCAAHGLAAPPHVPWRSRLGSGPIRPHRL